MVKRSSKARRASPVEQLQAALTRSLKDSVADTVLSVCEQFEDAVNKAVPGDSSSSGGGYDQFYADCRRLVDYVQQNMETSPGFGEQMDRVILACHSGATERVLSSVVTNQLWFHRRGDLPPFPVEGEAKGRRHRSKSSSSGSGRSSAAKKKVKETPPSRPRMATRASGESPAMHTRSSAGITGTSATGKRMATRGSPHNELPAKRPRRAAARKVLHEPSDEEKEEEDEEEEEEPVKPAKTRRGKKTQLHVEEEDDDELLPFKDAIGELCYPDRRSPDETKFFKERLRKSIQFVDALLCKPPPGKVCGRGCKKIRAQMCSSSTPCKNKMCRIWHDVEAHTDRCQNPQCEFKNRILLRETMHKVEIKKQQMADVKAELENRKVELKAITTAGSEVEHQKEKTQWEKDVAQLEHDLEEGEDELGVLEATKKTFWGILNDIGIELHDDVVDEFPDFSTHYEDKKAPRKARVPSKPSAASKQHPSPSGRSTRASQHKSGGPHEGNAGNDDGDDADAESVGDSIPRRTARRSTSGGPHGSLPPPGTDEETKHEDNNDHEQEEGHEHEHEHEHKEDQDYEPVHDHSDNEDYNRDDEPPLPPVGPPPFRQNPELDRTFALASGYSIQPPADDLETPAIAQDNGSGIQMDISGVNIPAELQSLAEVQQASNEISGALESLSSNPPADPASTPASASGPVPAGSPATAVNLVAAANPVNPINLVTAINPATSTGFTIRGNEPQNP